MQVTEVMFSRPGYVWRPAASHSEWRGHTSSEPAAECCHVRWCVTGWNELTAVLNRGEWSVTGHRSAALFVSNVNQSVIWLIRLLTWLYGRYEQIAPLRSLSDRSAGIKTARGARLFSHPNIPLSHSKCLSFNMAVIYLNVCRRCRDSFPCSIRTKGTGLFNFVNVWRWSPCKHITNSRLKMFVIITYRL